MFPEQVAQDQGGPSALPANNDFSIDGHIFKAYDVEHSDIHAISFLHVSDIKLIVGGDIVYGDCNQYIADADTAEKPDQWIEALNQIEALEPSIVVPGHKKASQVDGPYLIEAIRKYIRVFEEEWSQAKSAEKLEEAMNKRYPERYNALILELTCKMSFPQ